MISMRSWLFTALIFNGKGGKIWIDAVPKRARDIGTNIRKFKLFAECKREKCSRYAYKIFDIPMIIYINSLVCDDAGALRGLARSGNYKMIPEIMEKVTNKNSDKIKFWLYYTGDEKLVNKYVLKNEYSLVDHSNFNAPLNWNAINALCYGGHFHLLKLINITFNSTAVKYAFKSLNYEMIMHVWRNMGCDRDIQRYLKYVLKSKRITGLLLTSVPLVHWHFNFKINSKTLEEAREIAIKKNYETLPMIEQKLKLNFF